MNRHERGASDCVRGASGRDYAIRCHRERGGAAQWFVGSPTGQSWGAPFVSEPLARAWARTH